MIDHILIVLVGGAIFIFIGILTICYASGAYPDFHRKTKPVEEDCKDVSVEGIEYAIALGLSRLPVCEHTTAVFISVFEGEIRRQCPEFDIQHFETTIINNAEQMRKHGELYE